MKGPAVLEKARLYPLLDLVVSGGLKASIWTLLHSPEEPLEADNSNRHDG